MLVGVGFFPHGSITLEPENVPELKGVNELHTAMQNSSHLLKEIEPEIILLITPHGISLSKNYGLYYNKKAAGSAEWEGEYVNFKIKLALDQEFTEQIFSKFTVNHIPGEKIITYAQSEPVPLRWGEVVPLWYFRDLNIRYGIISIPFKRYTNFETMIPDLTKIGKSLNDFCRTYPKKIFIAISGDLAHTHLKNGPYGYSETAQKFDGLIENWLRNYLNNEKNKKIIAPLERAAILAQKALVCGLAGLFILNEIITNNHFNLNLIEYQAPSYYGMLVAFFSVKATN